MMWARLPSTQVRVLLGLPSQAEAPHLRASDAKDIAQSQKGWDPEPLSLLSGAENPACQSRSGSFLAQPGNPCQVKMLGARVVGWGRLPPEDLACPGRPKRALALQPRSPAGPGQTPKQLEPGTCAAEPSSFPTIPSPTAFTHSPAAQERFLTKQKAVGSSRPRRPGLLTARTLPTSPGILRVGGPGPTSAAQASWEEKEWRRDGAQGGPGAAPGSPRYFWEE